MPDAIPHDAVVAAIDLTPHIRAVREELEATRRLPLSLVQAIADAGLFRLYLPQAVGGLELPPLTVFRVIEELSKADGSVGWCTMIATAGSLFSGWLRPEVGRALFGQPPDVRIAGSLRPEGQAYPVDGGIVSRATGTLRVVSTMPTGSCAHVSSWMGTPHGRPPPVSLRPGH